MNENRHPIDKPEGQIATNKVPLLRWLENFWYHHKFGTIAVTFLVIVAIVCVVQLTTRETHDLYVVYGGPVALSQDESRAINDALRKVAGDYNKDGKVVVTFEPLYLMTVKQWTDFKSKNDAETDPNKRIDSMTIAMIRQSLSNNEDIFNTTILTGDATICLLDPGQYANVRANGGFVPLAEVLGERPEGAIDDYGIRLSDTAFGKYYGAFSCLPSDTILCVRRMSAISLIKNRTYAERYYAYSVKFMTSLMDFVRPE